MLTLRVSGTTEEEALTVPLRADGRPLLIGRDKNCDVVLDDRTLNVSQRHARLTFHASIEIEDLGSKNGTWVRGQRIQKAVVGAGEEFSLGRNARYRCVLIEYDETPTLDSPSGAGGGAPAAGGSLAARIQQLEWENARLRRDLNDTKRVALGQLSGATPPPSGGMPPRPTGEDGRQALEALQKGFAMARGDKAATSPPPTPPPRESAERAPAPSPRPPAVAGPPPSVARLASNLNELKTSLLDIPSTQAEARLSLLFGCLYMFSRAVERFTTRNARHLKNIVDVEMHTLLPGMERNLAMLVREFLASGDDASLGAVKDYLEELRKWVGRPLLAYQRGAREWVQRLLDRVGPPAIERGAEVPVASRILPGGRAATYWEVYCKEVSDLNPDRAFDQIEE